MERSEKIRKSYRKPGGSADLYDSILTYTALPGKKTERVVKHVFVPKGAFTPPFETGLSLTDGMNDMYEDVEVKTVRAEGICSGRKKEKNHER